MLLLAKDYEKNERYMERVMYAYGIDDGYPVLQVKVFSILLLCILQQHDKSWSFDSSHEMFDNMSDKNKRKFLDRFLYTLYLQYPCQRYETLDYWTN